MENLTALLKQMRSGDPSAGSRFYEAVYSELRQIAVQRMAKETPGATLQATELVHEGWLRLGGPDQQNWQNRAHFFAAAAEAMRRVLVDRARRRHTLRRGGEFIRTELDGIEIPDTIRPDELLEVNEAVEKLAQADPTKADLVKLRYFVGLTIEECASALGISEATAKRNWAYARAWLLQEINASRRDFR